MMASYLWGTWFQRSGDTHGQTHPRRASAPACWRSGALGTEECCCEQVSEVGFVLSVGPAAVSDEQLPEVD